MAASGHLYSDQNGRLWSLGSGGVLTALAGSSVDLSAAAVTLPAAQILASMLEEQVQRVATVTIPTAAVLALNATPVTLVAAPGASKTLIFEGAVLHKPAGTAYGNVAAGDDLALKYTDGSGIDVGVAEMTGFADQTTAQTRFILPQTGALAAGTVSDFVPVANAALVAHMLTGEITDGTSDFIVRVYYRIVPTVLP